MEEKARGFPALFTGIGMLRRRTVTWGAVGDRDANAPYPQLDERVDLASQQRAD